MADVSILLSSSDVPPSLPTTMMIRVPGWATPNNGSATTRDWNDGLWHDPAFCATFLGALAIRKHRLVPEIYVSPPPRLTEGWTSTQGDICGPVDKQRNLEFGYTINGKAQTLTMRFSVANTFAVGLLDAYVWDQLAIRPPRAAGSVWLSVLNERPPRLIKKQEHLR